MKKKEGKREVVFGVFYALVLLLQLIYRMLGMTAILPGFSMCVDVIVFNP